MTNWPSFSSSDICRSVFRNHSDFESGRAGLLMVGLFVTRARLTMDLKSYQSGASARFSPLTMCAVDDRAPRLYITLAMSHALQFVVRPARFVAIALLAFLAVALASPQQSPQKPAVPLAPKSAPTRQPSASRAITDPRLTSLDSVINDAIAKDEIPGAVLLVSNHGRVIWHKAYGSRSIIPQREAMTLDTIFDLASLTKVFATTAAVMKLVEDGKIRLNDPAVRYLPELGTEGATGEKNQITIRQLMTHTAGFAPDPTDANIPAGWSGAEPLLKEIYAEPLTAPPGDRFVYSDTGFVLLGEIVHRVSGVTLDEFLAKQIYAPLGMRETRFQPPADWARRIAPTEEVDLPRGAKAGCNCGHVLRGVVHDPRARQMDGIAGHAGLFSTADDLAIYCRMLLAGGVAPNGKRMFSAATVHLMTTPQQPPWVPSLRGLGWDIDSAYSAPRGELFPLTSFGMTGFTGTMAWIDPASQTFVILLTNSVHPNPRPAISSLRSRVSTIVASALNAGEPATPPSRVARSNGGAPRPYDIEGLSAPGRTLTGIDVLEQENFASLAGKRIGLITNQTGVDRESHSTIDLLAHAPGVKLVALFSPEHGIRGVEDSRVPSTTDAATGLPIYSLYGETQRPSPEMLAGLDALVFDIQDAGVRFYTYITTMAYSMEAAAKNHVAFYVLDRPDPLGGEAVEGPVLDPDHLNFVGYFPMPVRIGMTLGEMAQMFNAENKIGCDLHVVAMKNWTRRQWFEQTGLPWTAPSPNLRSLNAALLYPGLEILQNAGLSVGRGTDTPFELFGAPWIHATELADALNRRYVPGVRFVPTRFAPRSGPSKDKLCEGAALVITDRASLNSMLMGFEIAAALAKLYPESFHVKQMTTLVGNANALNRLENGDSPQRIFSDEDSNLEAFLKLRSKYLLYR
jgi:uncharacterized protein YbbC (DUF1343 family)/CubicO group peptidase (beta-lactamase class C family)